ncbi:MAG: SUMF1/EgtB/PvdO family nonheme iron enzyme [Verrucomicrobiae bacterium]|nr:SUMF1/EgtB/PvdO family nonheme iron enzyme [Verrucomicrobiae bacterium]
MKSECIVSSLLFIATALPLPARQANPAAPPAAQASADYFRLRDAGDAQLAAGNKTEAMALFEQARAADPSQLGIHDRIVRLFLDLGQRQSGLEAVETLFKLDPKLTSDPELKRLQQRLLTVSTNAPKVAPVDPPVALATRTAELAIRDAADAYSQGQTERVRQLGNEARDALLPILQGAGANHLAAWEAAGRAALLVQDNYLAAAALVNLERLEPNYAQTPRLLDLMAELNRRPIQGLLAEARAQPADFLKSFAGKPRSGTPFVNSLGMKFVPVLGTDVLFCVWETRVKDYAIFAQANSDVDTSWKDSRYSEPLENTTSTSIFDKLDRLATQKSLKVTPSEDCPVVNVSWEDAKAFCEWLTRKEQGEGRLSRQQFYRLPTDLEWSRAVGLPVEPGNTPEDRNMKIKGVYPWGTQWPPPAGAGNYADQSAKAQFNNWTVIDSYRDGFATTAPVGSFSANALGLFDLGGNVWEWCEDWYDSDKKFRVLRGGSWYVGVPDRLLSSYRNRDTPGSRFYGYGFRVVCVGALR